MIVENLSIGDQFQATGSQGYYYIVRSIQLCDEKKVECQVELDAGILYSGNVHFKCTFSLTADGKIDMGEKCFDYIPNERKV
jgi:hypothetical protein